MNQTNALSLADTPDDDAESITIELEAHDVSRFEWRVAVPLPVQEKLNYTVQAEFELCEKALKSWSNLKTTPIQQSRRDLEGRS
jgi:hypothetical protein